MVVPPGPLPPPPRRQRGWQPRSWTAPATALGARLRAARIGCGLTIAQIAREADAAYSTVIAWELGSHRPHRRSLRRLAHMLHVPYAELLALGDYPPKRHACTDPHDSGTHQWPAGT